MEKFKKLEEYDISLISIINMIPGHIYLKDKMGRYLWCNNQQVKSLNKFSQDDVIGKTDYELVDKKTADMLRKIDMYVMQSGLSVTIEEPEISEDGSKVFYLSKKTPLYDINNTMIGLIGSSFDLSEQKNLITIKEQNEQTLEEIIALMPGHVYWKDKNGIYLGCNNIQAKNLGLDNRNEIVGKTDFNLTQDKKIAQIFRENDLLVINSGKGISVEETVIINNQPVLMLSKKVPLKNKNGVTIGMVGISVDITELKNTKDKLKIAEERLAGMISVGANVAHELRTPLTAIEMGISGVKKYLPSLVDGYTKAKQYNLPVDFILPHHYEILSTLLDDIESETNYSNTIINIILMNVKQDRISSFNFQINSISQCVDEAIRRYPFKSKEMELIKWKHDVDFSFKGDRMLMIHVLFNLLKNALYFIESEGKGDITIWCESKNNGNLLYFKDTAKGIQEDGMSRLFEKFYTTTTNGTGLGLPFCKMVMEMFKGNISCTSKQGEFTQFILDFPTLVKKEIDNEKA